MLRTLGEVYPVREGGKRGLSVSFVSSSRTGSCEIRRRGDQATVRYATPAQAGRGLGALMSGLVRRDGTYRESTPFTTLGIMLDCSRNAVITVEHTKRWLRQLALLGYNMVMLYTEDTYELPGEPYFGYQRGAYTTAELRAIDTYAARLNIEIVPCIQTLGHLHQILRHGAYRRVRDTGSVLMVDEPGTYELVDKMIAHWRSVCRTKRVHIGMDEAHDLGRGRYLDRHGYRDGFELFNRHLGKVVTICRHHGLRPMIWSDMSFRLGSKGGDYYSRDTRIPRAVVKKIPKGVELVYWDYYHHQKSFYRNWIERHRAMGKEPVMASGIWTWNKYWYDHEKTKAAAGACIDACRESKVRELIFTQWGDNGAYCDHDSAFAGMVYCADRAYGARSPEENKLADRFGAVCGGSYRAHMAASRLHGGVDDLQPYMWDDPFFETRFRTHCRDNTRRMLRCAKGFAGIARDLARHRTDRRTGDVGYAYLTAKAFASRYALCARLLRAYRRKDTRALRAAAGACGRVRADVRKLEASFSAMWLRHNKPQGLETMQARFGMLEVRYREMARRIRDYVAGRVTTIPELDAKCPPA
jgi:hypothetical protein